MGFHVEIPPTPQIYTNGHTSDDDYPQKVLYHRHNGHLSYQEARERGDASEDRVESLFRGIDANGEPYFPWIEIEKVEHGSDLDHQGADFIFHLQKSDGLDYAELTGINSLRVDVKSSEKGVETHMKKGMRIGNEWWKYCMAVLNANWDDKMIYTDFLAQMSNLSGLLYSQVELDDFLSMIHPELSQYFQEAMARDYMNQRGALLEWVRSGMNRMN